MPGVGQAVPVVEPLSWWGRALAAGVVVVVAVLVLLWVRDDDLGEPAFAAWEVEPGIGFGPGATEVPIVVKEHGCASGRSAEGRIRAEVDHRLDAVVIAIGVRPLGGDQTCPGNPDTPYTVELDEPLGRRPIEGATGLR